MKISPFLQIPLHFLFLFAALRVGHASTYTWNLNTSTASAWNSASNWATSASDYPNAAGAVVYLTNNITTNNTLNVNSAITLGVLNIGDTSNTFTVAPGTAGALTFDNNGAGAQMNEVASKGDTISSNLILADNLTVSSVSANTFALSGTITSTGAARTLTINANNTGSITVATTGALNLTGTIVNSGAGAGAVSISGNIGSNVQTVLQNSSSSSLTLTGTNSFQNLVITAGTVFVRVSGTATGLGATTLGATSGSADASLLASSVNISNAINVVAGGSGTLTIGNYTGGSPTYRGAITLANDLTISASQTGGLLILGNISGTGNLTLSNNITNTAKALSITDYLNSNGSITLIGSGVGATILGGTIGSNVASITQNSTTSVLYITATNSSGALNICSGGAVTIGGSNAGGATTGNLGTGSVTNNGILAFNRSNNYTYNGKIAGSGTVEVIGTGTVTLLGLHSYTGATTVSSGELDVNGSLAAESAVTVSSGATLGGSGTAGGTVTGIDATINGSGLTTGAISLAGSSTLSGTTTSSGAVTVASGTTYLTAGSRASATSVNIQGTLSNRGGTLSGSTTVSGVLIGHGVVSGALTISNGGTLAVSSSSDVTTVDGKLTIQSGAKVSAIIDGTSSGSYSMIVVSSESNGMEIGDNTTLVITLNVNLDGSAITLIDNETSLAIDGKFTYVALNGTTYTVDSNGTFTDNVGTEYVLNYTSSTSGDSVNNDLTLAVVPEPCTWVMLLGGIGMLALGQKLRRGSLV